MKKVLILFFIAAFVGISLFGFSFMSEQTSHSRCLAVIVSGGSACADMSSPFGMLFVHFSAFQEFSSAVFNKSFLISLFMSILLLLAAVFGIIKKRESVLEDSALYFYRRQNIDFPGLALRLKFGHWLAIRDKNPDFS